MTLDCAPMDCATYSVVYDTHWELLKPLIASATGTGPNTGPGQCHIASVCTQYTAMFGVRQLADLFNGEAFKGRPISPSALITLIDCLRGSNGPSFPWQHLGDFLSALRVDWAAFNGDGDALSDFLSSMLLFSKGHCSSQDAGAMLRRIFAGASLQLTVEDLAPAIRSLWNDGYTWGRVLGDFLAGLLPGGWGLCYAGRLARGLTQGCLDAEELDLGDYEAMDAMDCGGNNPAVRIGSLLDAIIPAQQQSVHAAARIASDMRASFGDDWSISVGGGGDTQEFGSQAGCGLFIGRVLRQLRFARELEEGGEWGLGESVGLACCLCSSDGSSGGGRETLAGGGGEGEDWRLSRCNHAYFVGDILRQLRKDWPEHNVSLLVTALSSSPNFPSGSNPAPQRIVMEVLEGLGVQYWITTKQPAQQEGLHDFANSATATVHAVGSI